MFINYFVLAKEVIIESLNNSSTKQIIIESSVPSQATEIPPTVDNCASRDDNAVSASEIASDCAQRNTSAKVQLLQLQVSFIVTFLRN